MFPKSFFLSVIQFRLGKEKQNANKIQKMEIFDFCSVLINWHFVFNVNFILPFCCMEKSSAKENQMLEWLTTLKLN